MAAEFPDAFDKFAAFATALADRLDAERAGGAPAAPDRATADEGESPILGTDAFLSV